MERQRGLLGAKISGPEAPDAAGRVQRAGPRAPDRGARADLRDMGQLLAAIEALERAHGADPARLARSRELYATLRAEQRVLAARVAREAPPARGLARLGRWLPWVRRLER